MDRWSEALETACQLDHQTIQLVLTPATAFARFTVFQVLLKSMHRLLSMKAGTYAYRATTTFSEHSLRMSYIAIWAGGPVTHILQTSVAIEHLHVLQLLIQFALTNPVQYAFAGIQSMSDSKFKQLNPLPSHSQHTSICPFMNTCFSNAGTANTSKHSLHC